MIVGVALQMVCTQSLLVFRFSGQCCSLASDTFISILFAIFILSWPSIDFWRAGKLTMGDQHSLRDNETYSDTALLLCLIIVALGFSTFSIRCARSLPVLMLVTISYLFFSIPEDWSPHSTSDVVLYSVLVSIVVCAVWANQRRQEIQQRAS